jgi:hypothetical protein
MAFSKTGVAFESPLPLAVGTEKDGKFWGGLKWLTPEEWEKVKGALLQKSVGNTFIGLSSRRD